MRIETDVKETPGVVTNYRFFVVTENDDDETESLNLLFAVSVVPRETEDGGASIGVWVGRNSPVTIDANGKDAIGAVIAWEASEDQ